MYKYSPSKKQNGLSVSQDLTKHTKENFNSPSNQVNPNQSLANTLAQGSGGKYR